MRTVIVALALVLALPGALVWAQDPPDCTNGDCPPDPPDCTNGDCPPDPSDCTNGDCPPDPPDCTNGDCPPDPPDCTNGDCPPASDEDGDGVLPPDDCDDSDVTTYPGAPEVCDGKDNDCDLVVPEGEVDLDGDGYLACAECDDDNVDIHPGAADGLECDGIDNDCDGVPDDGWIIDQDSDGFTYDYCAEVGDDCDDTDPGVNPNALEIDFNFVDEDCNGDLGACDACFPWRNHGEYVRCIAHAAEELVGLGAISQEEGDALVSSAAHSDIGKKNYLPAECL